MAAHKSVTKKRIFDMYKSKGALDDPGLCCGCGAEAYGVEPDARKYTCECCGEDRVYGIEELMMKCL